MARLIDADAISYREIWKEEWLRNAGKFQQGVFKDEIDEMPTIDAVPVIRCKDCRYRVEKKGTAINKHCTWWYRTVDDDDYCSRGERKENA